MNTIIETIVQEVKAKEVGYTTYAISSNFKIRLTDNRIMQVDDKRIDNFKLKLSRLLQDQYKINGQYTKIGTILKAKYTFPMNVLHRGKEYRVHIHNNKLCVETKGGAPIYSRDVIASVLFNWLQCCGVKIITNNETYSEKQTIDPVFKKETIKAEAKRQLNEKYGIESKKREIPVKEYANLDTLLLLKQYNENYYICVDGDGGITVIDSKPKWNEEMQQWYICDIACNHDYEMLDKNTYKGLYMTSDDGTMTIKELINATKQYNASTSSINEAPIKTGCEVNVGEQYSLEDYEGVMPTEDKKECKCESECIEKQTEDTHIKLDAGKKIIIELGPVKITIE